MPIIIVKPKTLGSHKKKELKDAGYIVVEAENPSDVHIVHEIEELDKDVIFTAAINALGWGNDPTCRMAFGELIRKRLSKP